MKIGYAAALLLLLATPALADAKKTSNGVVLECKVTVAARMASISPQTIRTVQPIGIAPQAASCPKVAHPSKRPIQRRGWPRASRPGWAAKPACVESCQTRTSLRGRAAKRSHAFRTSERWRREKRRPRIPSAHRRDYHRIPPHVRDDRDPPPIWVRRAELNH